MSFSQSDKRRVIFVTCTLSNCPSEENKFHQIELNSRIRCFYILRQFHGSWILCSIDFALKPPLQVEAPAGRASLRLNILCDETGLGRDTGRIPEAQEIDTKAGPESRKRWYECTFFTISLFF